MQILQTRRPQTSLATKNACKNRIANVQLEAMDQGQVVEKQKPKGVKMLAKFSLVLDLLVLIPCWLDPGSRNNGLGLVSLVFMCQNKMQGISQVVNTNVFVTSLSVRSSSVEAAYFEFNPTKLHRIVSRVIIIYFFHYTSAVYFAW